MTGILRVPPAGSIVHPRTLGTEGLRLFFPLAALHAALWPPLWVLLYAFVLPLADAVPSSVWHAHEMIFGTYGAALIGFLTSAVPEWTDAKRPQGLPLFVLAGLWGFARLAGLLGADVLIVVAALADLAWLTAITAFLARAAICKRTTRLAGFQFWVAVLLVIEVGTRYAMLTGDVVLARTCLQYGGLTFLAILGLALARITPLITNRILDPSESTAPFRPHPGRFNLAPGLVFIALVGDLAGLSSVATGYLLIAAGAGFLDRCAEGFIGRSAFRAEIVSLNGAAALAGTGLLLVGCARLGILPSSTPGWHLALMGGLGVAVLTVFSIAGLLHTGRTLPFPWAAKVAVLVLVLATALRTLPDLGVVQTLPGPPYAIASLFWASGFLIWLGHYWPLLTAPLADED